LGAICQKKFEEEKRMKRRMTTVLHSDDEQEIPEDPIETSSSTQSSQKRQGSVKKKQKTTFKNTSSVKRPTKRARPLLDAIGGFDLFLFVDSRENDVLKADTLDQLTYMDIPTTNVFRAELPAGDFLICRQRHDVEELNAQCCGTIAKKKSPLSSLPMRETSRNTTNTVVLDDFVSNSGDESGDTTVNMEQSQEGSEKNILQTTYANVPLYGALDYITVHSRMIPRTPVKNWSTEDLPDARTHFLEPLLLVERKTTNDLVSSICGHGKEPGFQHWKDQKLRLRKFRRDTGCPLMLMVENFFTVAHQPFVGGDGRGKGGMPTTSFQNALLHAQLTDRINVIYSMNIASSINSVRGLMQYITEHRFNNRYFTTLYRCIGEAVFAGCAPLPPLCSTTSSSTTRTRSFLASSLVNVDLDELEQSFYNSTSGTTTNAIATTSTMPANGDGAGGGVPRNEKKQREALLQCYSALMDERRERASEFVWDDDLVDTAEFIADGADILGGVECAQGTRGMLQHHGQIIQVSKKANMTPTIRWQMALQCVEGIGELTAQKIVARYPSLQALQQAYGENDFDLESQQHLLSDIETDSRTTTGKWRKLGNQKSTAVHAMFGPAGTARCALDSNDKSELKFNSNSSFSL
jgi:ERCC4-type nuclease